MSRECAKLVEDCKEEGEGKESKIRRGGLPFWDKPDSEPGN